MVARSTLAVNEAEAFEPWLGEPFSATSEAIRDAASDLSPSGVDVLMLFRDDRFAFDEEGRMTHTRRWVYRILTTQGLEGWSVSEASWSPWHQGRPRIRARAILPDGSERWHDPTSAIELDADEAGLSGARRLIRAPLAVTVGSVVEEEVVIRDDRPAFVAGVSARHLLVMPVPVYRGRVILEAPETVPLRFAIRKAPTLEPRRESREDRVRLIVDYGGVPAAGAVEVGLPSDQPRYPHVAFSTGESWSGVASAFARAVDSKIAESDAEAVVRWLPKGGAASELDRIAELLIGLRGNVRYAPVELGAVDVTPRSPLATLQRGYGDGKDLATLLVAILRSEGIPAYPALLRAGYGMDIDPDLPGLGRFNHALVYIPADDPIWLDPGDVFSRSGEIAPDRQGRLALVASTNTQQLLRTPVSASTENRTVTTIEIFMAEEGPARVVESSVYQGAAEYRQRLVTSQVQAADRRLGYEAYVKAAYRAEVLSGVEETRAEDLATPFRLRLEAEKADRTWTSAEEGAAAIDLSYLITALPRELLVVGAGPRQGDFVFQEPFLTEWRYRIHPPAQMAPRRLPKDSSRRLGTGRLMRSFRREGSQVHAVIQLDTGPRHLTAKQFNLFREAVQALLVEESLVLWFDRQARTKSGTPGRR